MHEASMARAILEIVERKAKSASTGPFRVVSVRVRAGEFRNVDEASLRFAFENLRDLYDGLERLSLNFELVEAKARCAPAGHEYRPSIDSAFCCSACGGGIGEIIAGEELDITGITIETGEYQCTK